MKRVLGVVLVAFFLSLGLTVSKAVVAPQSVKACGTFTWQDQRAGSRTVYDYYAQHYTTIEFRLTRYFDNCATYKYVAAIYSADATPIGNKFATARAWANGVFQGGRSGCNENAQSWYCAENFFVYTGYPVAGDNGYGSSATWQSSPNFSPQSSTYYLNGV